MASDVPPPILQRKQSAAGLVMLAALGFGLFWVYGSRPLVAQPWQWADDGLYLRQAEAIVRWLNGESSQWLGPYDSLILAKVPLFPIWLAAIHITHLPLRLAEYAIILMLPWLFHAAVRPFISFSRWQSALVVITLCALPNLPSEERLVRSALQLALSSACEICAIGTILRARSPQARWLVWPASTGLMFSLAYLNREESVWLLPIVVCALLAIVMSARQSRRFSRVVLSIAALAAAATIPLAAVSSLNYQSYGLFLTTTRHAPAFVRAHQLLTSLRPEARERYVPIPASTRAAAYDVSPTFAMFRSYMEGTATDPIARNRSHLFSNGHQPTEREFFVSNFQMVLAEAAFQAGARTAPASEAMFAEIATQLQAAIDAGRITAGSSGPALMSAPLPGDYGRIARQAVLSLLKLYLGDGVFVFDEGVSSGNAVDLWRMGTFTNASLAPTEEVRGRLVRSPGAKVAHALYNVVTRLEMVLYAAGSAAVVVMLILTMMRLRTPDLHYDQVLVALGLAGSLVAFGFFIGLVDVLGFPIVKWTASSYNTLGYAPLSVLTAFGLVLIFARLERPVDVSLRHGRSNLTKARGADAVDAFV